MSVCARARTHSFSRVSCALHALACVRVCVSVRARARSLPLLTHDAAMKHGTTVSQLSGEAEEEEEVVVDVVADGGVEVKAVAAEGRSNRRQ